MELLANVQFVNVMSLARTNTDHRRPTVLENGTETLMSVCG